MRGKKEREVDDEMGPVRLLFGASTKERGLAAYRRRGAIESFPTRAGSLWFVSGPPPARSYLKRAVVVPTLMLVSERVEVRCGTDCPGVLVGDL